MNDATVTDWTRCDLNEILALNQLQIMELSQDNQNIVTRRINNLVKETARQAKLKAEPFDYMEICGEPNRKDDGSRAPGFIKGSGISDSAKAYATVLNVLTCLRTIQLLDCVSDEDSPEIVAEVLKSKLCGGRDKSLVGAIKVERVLSTLEVIITSVNPASMRTFKATVSAVKSPIKVEAWTRTNQVPVQDSAA